MTNDEIISYPVESKIPLDPDLNNFIYTWAEEIFIIAISFSFATGIVTVKHNLFLKSKIYKAKSSKDFVPLLIFRYFHRKYNQPIYFTIQEDLIIETEPEILEPSQNMKAELVQPLNKSFEFTKSTRKKHRKRRRLLH